MDQEPAVFRGHPRDRGPSMGSLNASFRLKSGAACDNRHGGGDATGIQGEES